MSTNEAENLVQLSEASTEERLNKTLYNTRESWLVENFKVTDHVIGLANQNSRILQ